jgi:hypothetical protein
LRPFAVVVTLVEVGLAVWALSGVYQHWRGGDGALPGQFWGALAGFGFTGGLVVTNVVGMLQTIGRLGWRRPVGSRLPVRLQAADEANPEVVWGLGPLGLAFGGPVYPLIRLAWLDWGELRIIWVGMALASFVVAAIMLFIVSRQFYLLWNGGQTVVEVSSERMGPGETIQVAIGHRPGRFKTQGVVVQLVCRETVRRAYDEGREKGASQRMVSRVIYEERLRSYTGAEIALLEMGGPLITMVIPAEARASTEPDHYPSIEWRIEVKVKVANGPDFGLTFPCKVEELGELGELGGC